MPKLTSTLRSPASVLNTDFPDTGGAIESALKKLAKGGAVKLTAEEAAAVHLNLLMLLRS